MTGVGGKKARSSNHQHVGPEVQKLEQVRKRVRALVAIQQTLIREESCPLEATGCLKFQLAARQVFHNETRAPPSLVSSQSVVAAAAKECRMMTFHN